MFNRITPVRPACSSDNNKTFSITFRSASSGIQSIFEENMAAVQAAGFTFTSVGEKDYKIDIDLTNVTDFNAIRKACQKTLSQACENRILFTKERSEISSQIENFAAKNGFEFEQRSHCQPGFDREGSAF